MPSPCRPLWCRICLGCLRDLLDHSIAAAVVNLQKPQQHDECCSGPPTCRVFVVSCFRDSTGNTKGRKHEKAIVNLPTQPSRETA
jgi:hypothetical protein